MPSLRWLSLLLVLFGFCSTKPALADPVEKVRLAPDTGEMLALTGIDPEIEGFGTSYLTYDFGTIDMARYPELEARFQEDKRKGVFRFGVIEHSFLFKNTSRRRLSIESLFSFPKGFAVGAFLENGAFTELKEIAPDQEVRLFVSINVQDMEAGLNTGRFKIIESRERRHIWGESASEEAAARILLKVNVLGEISASVDQLDFGKIDVATGSVKSFELTVGRYYAAGLASGQKIRVVSENPQFEIKAVGVVGPNPGLVLESDGWRLEKEGNTDLGRDVVIQFTVKVPPYNYLGPIGYPLKLATEGAPLSVRNSDWRINVRGEVMGHMRVNILPIRGIGVPRSNTKRTLITVETIAPVTPQSLRVSCANPKVVCRFVPWSESTVPNSNLYSPNPNAKRVSLEIVAELMFESGTYDGTITITTTKSPERYELHVVTWEER